MNKRIFFVSFAIVIGLLVLLFVAGAIVAPTPSGRNFGSTFGPVVQLLLGPVWWIGVKLFPCRRLPFGFLIPVIIVITGGMFWAFVAERLVHLLRGKNAETKGVEPGH